MVRGLRCAKAGAQMGYDYLTVINTLYLLIQEL
jgi:hypothetical protein